LKRVKIRLESGQDETERGYVEAQDDSGEIFFVITCVAKVKIVADSAVPDDRHSIE